MDRTYILEISPLFPLFSPFFILNFSPSPQTWDMGQVIYNLNKKYLTAKKVQLLRMYDFEDGAAAVDDLLCSGRQQHAAIDWPFFDALLCSGR